MKNLVLIILLFLIPSLYGQKVKPTPSKWNANGKAEISLPKESYQYFNKGKLYYYLSNDNDNIYLDMRIEDSEAQNKILKQGMMVWICTENKQLKNCGIRFPVGTQRPGRPGRPGQQGGSEGGFSSGSPVSQATTIELTGFMKEERRMIPANNEDNIRGSVHYDSDGNLIYKLIVPVSKIELTGDLKATPISLGLEPAPVIQMRQGPPQGGGGSASMSGGSVPRGGGGGGGGRGRGGAPMGGGGFSGAPGAQPAPVSVIVWIKDVTLAAQQ